MTDLQISRTARARLGAGTALAGVAAAVLLAGLGALPAAAQDAQDSGPGGPRLDVALGFGLSYNDNPDLLPAGFGDAETSASLSLGFALITETALSRLSFSGSGGLVLQGDGSAAGLNNPVLGLDWDYGTENAGLSFSAKRSDTDLSRQSATAADFGPGNRLTDSLAAEIALGKTAPFGATLRAGAEQTDYQAASPGLTDRRSADLGLDLRADFFQVWQATLGLNAGAFQAEGDARRDTRSAVLGLTYLRPRGTWAISYGLTATPEGDRQTLNLSHTAELPSGSLSFSLGAARGTEGQNDLTGAFGWTQAYATGTLDLALSRALISSETADAETLSNTATLQWSQQVTRTGSLSLGLSYADEAPTGGGASTTTSQISAGWSQELGQDWALDLNLTHALRDVGATRGQSNLISLGLSRDFSLRF